jgi:MFS family permease
LLIPLAQNGEHLIIIRLLAGLAIVFAALTPFPIAAELMPAQHRRAYGAIYEMMLASSFTLVPLVGFMVVWSPATRTAFGCWAVGDSRTVCRAAAGLSGDPGEPALASAAG